MKKIISVLAAILLVLTMSTGVLAAPAADETTAPFAEYAANEGEPVPLLGAENETGGSVDTDSSEGTDEGSLIDFTIENYVVDDANLFTDTERETMFGAIKAIRENHKFDIVIHTTSSMNGKGPQDYSENFFNTYEYGYGEDRDGLIVMLCITDSGSRDIYIAAHGAVGKRVFDSGYTLDFDNGPVFGKMLPLLKNGEYYEAEMSFLEIADDLLTLNENRGNSDDYDYDYDGDSERSTKDIFLSEVIAVAAACVIALVIVLLLKRTMKTNRIQRSAENYEKPGSMRVTYSDERFIRTDVSRSAKPKNNDNGGSDSSDSDFSGGGGSF